jgi:lincosamide nucleotidyltransferase
MNTPEQLLRRLDEIGAGLAKKPSALALIGLGSVGLEHDRLDQFSDLDFFVIVKNGSKPQYLEDLSWLTEIAPVAYCFANTPDGCKLLYEDGVFCEFAVFDENEIKEAIFSPGRVVWKAQGVSDGIGLPQRSSERRPPPSTEWLIGEALTNLYVGLCRDRRGEKLSAMRFIQGYAVERTLELAEKVERSATITRDEFSLERRYEQRVPALASRLPEFLQGYEKNRASALAVLAYLDENFEINPAMKQAVLALCGQNS